MDWSGEITAGLAIKYSNPDEPLPCSAGTFAVLGKPFDWRFTDVVSGGTTYPAPEPFDCQSDFGTMPWLELLDGQSTITIEYTEPILSDGMFIKHGFIALNSATLIVEGVIVPEPATLWLLFLGVILMKRKLNA